MEIRARYFATTAFVSLVLLAVWFQEFLPVSIIDRPPWASFLAAELIVIALVSSIFLMASLGYQYTTSAALEVPHSEIRDRKGFYEGILLTITIALGVLVIPFPFGSWILNRIFSSI